jgi:hypothetical protein
MFVTTEDLNKHILEEHGNYYWVCNYCGDETNELHLDNIFIYDTAEDWVSHVKDDHLPNIPISQLQDLSSLSQRKFVQPMECPLCDITVSTVQAGLDAHIAGHLHSFALRALPWGLSQGSHGSDTPGSSANIGSETPSKWKHLSNLSDLEWPDHEKPVIGNWSDWHDVKNGVVIKEDYVEAWIQNIQEHNVLSLGGVPVVSQFIQRDSEMRELERLLVDNMAAADRQKVVILHGLGGIGKTQLAVEFARKHHRAFSSTVWLDGSSETSLKQSFASIVQRLPQDELTTEGAEMLKHSAIDDNVAVRECLRWLSLPLNQHWLLIFDSVDRDYHDKDDPQAYNVKVYFPDADRGSILITSRLASLQTLGPGIKVGMVETEQAKAILESNAERAVESKSTIACLV